MSTYSESISFSGFVVITQRWADFLAMVNAKSLLMQYITISVGISPQDSFQVFAYDGDLVYTCILVSPTYSASANFTDPTYTVTQNNTDCNTFTNTYEATCNQRLARTDPFGDPIVTDFNSAASFGSLPLTQIGPTVLHPGGDQREHPFTVPLAVVGPDHIVLYTRPALGTSDTALGNFEWVQF